MKYCLPFRALWITKSTDFPFMQENILNASRNGKQYFILQIFIENSSACLGRWHDHQIADRYIRRAIAHIKNSFSAAPGAILLTLIPKLTKSRRMERESASTACLVAQ